MWQISYPLQMGWVWVVFAKLYLITIVIFTKEINTHIIHSFIHSCVFEKIKSKKISFVYQNRAIFLSHLYFYSVCIMQQKLIQNIFGRIRLKCMHKHRVVLENLVIGKPIIQPFWPSWELQHFFNFAVVYFDQQTAASLTFAGQNWLFQCFILHKMINCSSIEI